MRPLADRPADEIPLGERRARQREQHLCLRCGHHAVCAMARSLDPAALVVIASCLFFEPAEPETDERDER